MTKYRTLTASVSRAGKTFISTHAHASRKEAIERSRAFLDTYDADGSHSVGSLQETGAREVWRAGQIVALARIEKQQEDGTFKQIGEADD